MSVDAETRDLVARALAEDLGTGDVTAEAVVPGDVIGTATITQKPPGVVFGLEVAAEVFRQAAVAAGGGTNHRMGLHDAILIKENHAALVGGVGEAVRRAREARPEMPVEVECPDLAEIREAIEAGASRLLLDNMTPAELQEAVAAVRRTSDAVELEASGGVPLENVAEIGASGVDYVSIGALTHSAPALDLS